MDNFQKEFIGLIQSAFTCRASALSSDFDWVKAVDTAKKHNIAPIVFYGALNCGIPRETEHMQELHRLTLQSLMVSTRQTYEIEQIANAFEQDSIDYMPLKGVVLKPLYPQPEMRTMGDADILIKLDQYPEIEKIMARLGFSFQQETNHELIWEKPSLFLELHKSIMTTYNKDFYRYFGNGWKLANKIPDRCRYEMSAEDFYIYIFVHLTKHYRISGIGIKHLLDLWVYIQAKPDLDWGYITKELSEMNLAKFHQNVVDTIGVWFDDGEETEVTDLITNVLFNSGQYGSAEMSMVNRALQKGESSALKIKLKIAFASTFLPYKAMKEKYKILKKAPFLLPVMWAVRFFDVVFCQSERFKKYVKRMSRVSAKQLDENKRALYAVGLDFRYGK